MASRRELLLGALALPLALSAARADAPRDDAVLAILRDRVDVARQSVGIVAGVLGPDGRKLFTYGRSDTTPERPLDGDSVFEIGSITKVFTALLLADMAIRGEVALDDPVAKFLPAAVTVPARSGKKVTLLDLATYTSGLPNMPDNFTPKDSVNPSADYTVEQLYAFLSNYSLKFDPGAHYEYANLGFGLLGHVLALHAGKSYEDLVTSRIIAPLGMESTGISLSRSMRERLTRGHNSILQPTANWDLPTLAGAGALRSTANDLFKFLDAASDAEPDAPLGRAFDLLLKTRRPADNDRLEVGLGWFISSANDDNIVSKHGGTGGYSSFIGYSTRTLRGSLVLSNAGYSNSNDDIGMLLINQRYSLNLYPPQVEVDPAIMATYAGTYRMTPQFSLTIRADGGRLFVRGTGQDELELFADAIDRFFMRAVDAQAIFLKDKDGQVGELIWHQNGHYQYCRRTG